MTSCSCTGPLIWPEKKPDATLTYSFNMAADIIDPNIIQVATFAYSPSGDGEMVASNFIINPSTNIASVTLAAGPPGRIYTCQILINLSDGVTVIEYDILLPISRQLVEFPVTAAPSSGFSDQLRWAD